jgi:hypothetical protein
MGYMEPKGILPVSSTTQLAAGCLFDYLPKFIIDFFEYHELNTILIAFIV